MQMFLNSLIQHTDLTNLRDASFKNFHSKGMDYICLKRTPYHTLKIYILDGDASKLPEVVNPHDHRYAFRTTVLKGEMVDKRFVKSPHNPNSIVFNAFDYMTPLNGGKGFSWRGEESLFEVDANILHQGHSLYTKPDMLHTISMRTDQTVIMLDQYEDELALDQSTSTWVRKGEPAPDTSGLYEKFTESEFVAKLKWLQETIEWVVE